MSESMPNFKAPQEQPEENQPEVVDTLGPEDIVEEEAPKDKVVRPGRFGSMLAGAAALMGVAGASNNAEAAPRNEQTTKRVAIPEAKGRQEKLPGEAMTKLTIRLNNYFKDVGHGLEKYKIEFQNENRTRIIVEENGQKKFVPMIKDTTIQSMVEYFEMLDKKIAALGDDPKNEEARVQLQTELFEGMEAKLEAATR
jgi:hypothetical protein